MTAVCQWCGRAVGTPAIDRGVLTAEQAAAIVGVSDASIRRWIRDGSFPGFRRGNVYRIPRLALDRWLAEHPAVAS